MLFNRNVIYSADILIHIECSAILPETKCHQILIIFFLVSNADANCLCSRKRFSFFATN